MGRQQQLQVRNRRRALHGRDRRDELIALPGRRLDVAVQVAGIELPAQLAHQLLEAVVADGDVLPPGADQGVFRQHHVGAAHEQVQHVVLALRQADGLAAAGERPAAEVEHVGSERHLGRCGHAADRNGGAARSTRGPPRQCATAGRTRGHCSRESADSRRPSQRVVWCRRPWTGAEDGRTSKRDVEIPVRRTTSSLVSYARSYRKERPHLRAGVEGANPPHMPNARPGVSPTSLPR